MSTVQYKKAAKWLENILETTPSSKVWTNRALLNAININSRKTVIPKSLKCVLTQLQKYKIFTRRAETTEYVFIKC